MLFIWFVYTDFCRKPGNVSFRLRTFCSFHFERVHLLSTLVFGCPSVNYSFNQLIVFVDVFSSSFVVIAECIRDNDVEVKLSG